MSAAPPGTSVRLYLDGPALVEPGDLLRSGTGRTYEVTSCRRAASGRWYLRATVLPGYVNDPDAVVHLFRWYRR